MTQRSRANAWLPYKEGVQYDDNSRLDLTEPWLQLCHLSGAIKTVPDSRAVIRLTELKNNLFA